MDQEALNPHGLAMLAYFEGDSAAELVIRRDDGFEVPLPASYFFRPADEFSPLELAALQHCRGRVLDIGAGSGLHALELQSDGLDVTALDISPLAVDIMTRRSVRDARLGDVLEFADGPFDTLLMLGHGIGMVENLHGLSRFLSHARRLTRSAGQLVIHTLDVGKSDDPVHLAYQDANRLAGRYVGETRLQFEHRGASGPFCGWLHVDPQTLAEHGEQAGWACETSFETAGGDYLVRLTLSS